ncbi:hypothetical protein PIB30_079123 [Stylosanthes scabra]|uniref:Uncharacterized protein n=1 Tax=Stylosanthes scabra TaxID=79078 RepID=A0ABU6TSF2_9FABA|nr:hypothetical protein [Stylosanthes scabra]
MPSPHPTQPHSGLTTSSQPTTLSASVATTPMLHATPRHQRPRYRVKSDLNHRKDFELEKCRQVAISSRGRRRRRRSAVVTSWLPESLLGVFKLATVLAGYDRACVCAIRLRCSNRILLKQVVAHVMLIVGVDKISVEAVNTQSSEYKLLRSGYTVNAIIILVEVLNKILSSTQVVHFFISLKLLPCLQSARIYIMLGIFMKIKVPDYHHHDIFLARMKYF